MNLVKNHHEAIINFCDLLHTSLERSPSMLKSSSLGFTAASFIDKNWQEEIFYWHNSKFISISFFKLYQNKKFPYKERNYDKSQEFYLDLPL